MKKRHVSMSDAVRLGLRKIGQHCKKVGRFVEFARAAAQIADALSVRPLPPTKGEDVFGCPHYRLPNAGLLVCAATISPIYVMFAAVEPHAHENGDAVPPVIVLRFKLMS
jgi:hypothetical protein